MDDLVKRVDATLKDVTPGPWAVSVKGRYVGITHPPTKNNPLGGLVCKMHSGRPELHAEARFIAAARGLVPAMRDRIEADAKLITELALDALAAGTQAEEAYQAQLAAEARVKELEAALRRAKDFIEDQYACAEAQALHGEYVAKEARPVWNALCATLEGEKT